MRILASVLVVLFLAACGPRMVQTDVTRFTAASSGPPPGTVTIVPTPEQRGSLEFQSYAEMVASELRAQGFEPVPATAEPPPDYVARLSWGISDPVTEIYSSPSTVFGGTSVFGSRTGFGLGVGVPLGSYYDRVDSTTSYTKQFQMILRPYGDADAPNLFEGRAVTSGSINAIQPVMPYLIEALFTNFPGRSGTTERVSIPQR